MTEQNSLEEQFKQLIEDWEEYCSQPQVLTSSFGNVVRECESYKNIVAMGKDVLPFIRKLYDVDRGSINFRVMKCHGLVYAVKEIVGKDFQVPQEIKGKMGQIGRYTADWLDKNMDKYCKREN